MKWIKKGFIFKPDGSKQWAFSHAQVPLAQTISHDRVRLYYGTRDAHNRTRTSYVEVSADNPKDILYVHPNPILELGAPGAFDDSGIMPSDIIEHNGKIYFYYVGWNTANTARYRTALGLAISEDGGKSFHKVSDGPIMDRNIVDPISVSCQSVIIEDGIWKAWYMSYTKWEEIHGKMEPFYHIKYAESTDGIHWIRTGQVCIPLNNDEGGIACPCVIKKNGLYHMWYSTRKKRNYRKDPSQSYRIGYAQSKDGIQWKRMDKLVGITVSEQGWDSEMIAYPFVLTNGTRTYMFYNGNGFGKAGFGYAELEK